MTKEEFAYGVNRTDRIGREQSERRAKFYDWYQENKDNLPPTKAIAKKFGVQDSTVSHWIDRIDWSHLRDAEKDSE